MTRMALRVLLGTALIVHALANAVFPLRGIDAVAPGVWSFWLTGIYTLAILGLLIAGLGVLSVSPFHRVIVPAAITGSATSMLARTASSTRASRARSTGASKRKGGSGVERGGTKKPLP